MSTIGCTCSCDIDFDPARMYHEKRVRARRQYECYECDAKIEVGDLYSRVSILDCEGAWENYHICIPCDRIAKDLAQGCWLLGGLRETLEECLGFDYLRTGPNDTE